MGIGRTFTLVGLAAGLCGCQSMAMSALKALDEKPYAHPILAGQLQPVTLPGAAPPATVASLQPALPVSEAAAAPQPSVAPAAPARTDIRGAGDGSMKVDRVVITGNTKEIAHKVPDFSREQVAGMVCRATKSSNPKRLEEALPAYRATVAAHDIRAAYEAGQRTLKEANAAEKKRQDTVKELLPPGMWMSLMGGRQKKDDLPPARLGALVLENVDLFTFTENGKEVMAVSGVVRNTGAATEELPPLTLEVLDRWEFILAGQTSLLPFAQLEPGEAKPFEMRFLNPPDTTGEVYVHFAPPFEYRARRDCDFFDPEKAGQVEPDVFYVPANAAPPMSPIHTAGELNLLTRVYRSEAQAAWNCRDGDKSKPPPGGVHFATEGSGERAEGFSISLSMGKPNMERMCAPTAKRLRWRETFELAEATDEAWGSMRAAEEARGRLAAGEATQADVDAADTAQRQAYALFRSLGAKALARIGSSAPDVEVVVDASMFGYAGFDKGGFYLEFSGSLINKGAEPKQIDALMLAVVDRLEQPLVSIVIDNSVTLAPGETKAFTHNIPFSDPASRGNPERAPRWQVRVGAMGR